MASRVRPLVSSRAVSVVALGTPRELGIVRGKGVEKSTTALYYAAKNGHENIVEKLIGVSKTIVPD